MTTFLALIILPKLLVLPMRENYVYVANRIAAGIATLGIIVWSASIKTALGYGGMLMMTLPFCWAIFGVLYFAYKFFDRKFFRQEYM